MEVISCVCVVGFDLDEVAAEIMLINCFWNYFYYFLWQNILLAFDEDYAFVAAEVISVFFSFRYLQIISCRRPPAILLRRRKQLF